MSEFLRTLWSATTCDFCGTRHDLGICPNCGSRRTEGEHQYLESPHIEKLRAMKQVILRYKAEDTLRIASVGMISVDKVWAYTGVTEQLPRSVVEFTCEQKRIIGYIMRIVTELTGQQFQIPLRGFDILEAMQRRRETEMMELLNTMLEYLESALDVEEKLTDIVTIQNGGEKE